MMKFPTEWKVIIHSCSSHHQPDISLTTINHYIGKPLLLFQSPPTSLPRNHRRHRQTSAAPENLNASSKPGRKRRTARSRPDERRSSPILKEFWNDPGSEHV